MGHLLFLSAFFLLAAPTALGFCPKGCRCDDMRLRVECTNSTLGEEERQGKSVSFYNIDVLPIALNTRIKYIKMSFNKIRIVDASFQFYEHLIEIDLSSNIIEDIEDKSFAAQKYLIKLDLSYNKIQDIKPKVFVGLLRLNYLSLRANELEFIRPGVLEHLISLVSLDLGDNQISTLSPEVFLSNTHLEVLVLDYNKLSVVPTEAVRRCVKMRSLDLSGNTLTNFSQPNIFPSLQHLNLSTCSLSRPSALSFTNLSLLTSLDLSNNQLQAVPTSELAGLTSLRRLELSGNLFTSLAPHSFRELHNLQQLYVTNCSQLSQVQVAAFHNNLDLRVVDLSHNYQLAQLQPHAFPRILHLTRLSLASTAIRSVKPESVPWQRLTYLDLTNVSLDCSCELAWLLKVKVHGARCFSPAALRGFALSSLRVSGLGCGSGLQTEVVVVGLACVLLLTLVIITAALCCLCRHKLRHLLATCSVSAEETSYKNSYDNCVYLGKINSYVPSDNDRNPAQRLVPHTLSCKYDLLSVNSYEERTSLNIFFRRESDDINQLKPLCVEATPL